MRESYEVSVTGDWGLEKKYILPRVLMFRFQLMTRDLKKINRN